VASSSVEGATQAATSVLSTGCIHERSAVVNVRLARILEVHPQSAGLSPLSAAAPHHYYTVEISSQSGQQETKREIQTEEHR
jgi:hypothetical protein